jgi:ElaB/YqjD/DUF883 family membrane-anchored ribosome-binding protein
LQRAKEQLAQTAATARDDVSGDLRRLSDDLVKLKDTVAEIAKTMGSQVGDAASDLGAEIASTAQDQASSMVAEFERVARRNPLGVVAGALCVGLVIGLLSGRR